MDLATPAGQEPADSPEISFCSHRGCWQEVDAQAAVCPSCRRRRPEEGWIHGPRPGRLIRRKYRLQKILGIGGFGSVYLARQMQRDLDLGPVVLKFLHRQWADQSGFRKRFVGEMQAIRKLGSHPHVVTVFDLDEDESGLPFMVMEYLPGEALQDLIDREGRIDLAQALNIAGQVANALDACHAEGIVHRDLKPDNIRLLKGKTDFAKVLDFGIARDTVVRQTVAHTFAGTPQYMAPEQILLQPVDGGADIYALGVLLFQCLAGRPPIQALSPMEYIKLNVNEQPDPLRSICPELPEKLEALLDKMMAKDRADRPASMSEVEQWLQEIALECGTQYYLMNPPDTWREVDPTAPTDPGEDEDGCSEEAECGEAATLEPQPPPPGPEPDPAPSSGSLSRYIPRQRLLHPGVLVGLVVVGLLVLILSLMGRCDTDFPVTEDTPSSAVTPPPLPPDATAPPAQPGHGADSGNRDALRQPDAEPAPPPTNGGTARTAPPEPRARTRKVWPRKRTRKRRLRGRKKATIRPLPAPSGEPVEPIIRALPSNPEETKVP